jgi:putative membrane protein
MMRGLNWFGNGGCASFFGGYFSMWHYIILIGVALLVIGIITLNKKQSPTNDDTLNTLKKMYVNGEITEEEYLKKKNVIERK